jgi:serine/threonine protein phosphatase PrpC
MSVVSIPDAVAITFAGQCDRGRVREENQDSVRHRTTPLGDLMIVADGIGGYAGGGVASYMAVETISASVAGMPAFFPAEIAIEEAVCHANAAIAAAAAEPDTPNNRMGSTVVVALLRTESDRAQAPVSALIGHVGDSRAYLLHHGRLTRITRDHSAVQELLDTRLISAEEVEDHPDASMLTRCLGHEPNVRVDVREVSLEVGDSLLLCSDGLWGYVSDQEIERIVADPALDTEAASQALLDLAIAAGGHDNVGIQLARVSVPAIRSTARMPYLAPEPQLESLAFEPVLAAIAPELPLASSHASMPAFIPAPAPVPATAPAYRPVLLHEPVSTISTATNPARYAESMMLPELIIVPRSESVSALRSSLIAMSASARPQVGFARLAAIFLLAFAASSTLAYLAVANNWFGILHSVR